MNVKFATARGSNRLTSKSYYIGIPKHERTMSKKETYALCADRTGYKPTAVRAVFLALREYLKENAARGNITYVDGISSVRNYVRGAFEGLGGPWVKGWNYLMVESVEMDPFKALLAGVVPQNDVGGAKPVINTVFDETTREYGEITGTDVGTICGVITGSFPTADAAFDTERNALELALRLDEAIHLALADVVPAIVTDESLTKLRVDNVMDLATPRPEPTASSLA